MNLQETAKNLIVVKLIEMLDCNQGKAETLAKEIISNLEEHYFFIQHDWERGN